MNPETKNLFREKNLKKATDPEQLSGYLKVTGLSAWLVVIAAGLVLVAILIWFFFGKLQTIVKGAGYCQDGTIICYFPYDEIDNITIGSEVDIEGHTGIVKNIFQNDICTRISLTVYCFFYPEQIPCGFSAPNSAVI